MQAAVFGCLSTVVEKGSGILGEGTQLMDNLTRIVETVVMCVSAKPDALPMVCSAFALLGTVGRQHATAISMFKENEDNCTLVTKAMHTHSVCAELMMRASTLFMLCAKGDEAFARKLAEMFDGVNTITRAIRQFPDDPAMLSCGFEALWQIALATSTRDAMIVGDIVQASCKAMLRYKADRDVQEYACRLMWALMTADNSSNQKAFNQEGAQRLVVGAMKNPAHAEDLQVQAAGAWAISLLASPMFPDHVQNMVQNGAIPQLKAAMMLDVTNEELQHGCCAALASISCGQDKIKQVVASSGCFGLLMKASINHTECVGLVEHSTTAMTSLAEARAKILAEEFATSSGAKVVAQLEQGHPENATVVRNCALLASIFGSG